MISYDLVIALGLLLVIALIVIAYLIWRLMRAEHAKPPVGRPRSSGSGRPTTAARSRASDTSRGNDERNKINWLLGRSGSVKGMNFPIGQQTVSAGRDVRNFLQISNDAASNRHLVLIGDQAGLKIIDINSSNGTFLNGTRIDAKVEYQLSDGDEIKIADAVFLYRSEGRYEDHSQSQRKEISLQPKTAALSAVGADGTANPLDANGDL